MNVRNAEITKIDQRFIAKNTHAAFVDVVVVLKVVPNIVIVTNAAQKNASFQRCFLEIAFVKGVKTCTLAKQKDAMKKH